MRAIHSVYGEGALPSCLSWTSVSPSARWKLGRWPLGPIGICDPWELGGPFCPPHRTQPQRAGGRCAEPGMGSSEIPGGSFGTPGVGVVTLVVSQGPKREGGGGRGGGGGRPGEAVQAPGPKRALHGPEHHAGQHKQQHHNEGCAPPVPAARPAAGQAAPTAGRARGGHGRCGHGGLARAHVHIHEARRRRARRRGRRAAAQLGALQPHGLLPPQVCWHPRLQLAAGVQRGGPGSGHGRGPPAERAGHGLATRPACGLGGCHPCEALQAEDVGAGELLGCLEDVVVAREADGAFQRGGRFLRSRGARGPGAAGRARGPGHCGRGAAPAGRRHGRVPHLWA